MGNAWRIIKGVKIWRINTKYNVLWVSGHNIAGETNSYVYLYDTVLPRKRLIKAPAFPTNLSEEDMPEDIYDEEVHRFDAPTITFQPE